MRKYCIHGYEKDAIVYTTAGNHTRTRPRKGMKHRDGHVGFCRHYAPESDAVISGRHNVCFDPENLWCIPNNCKIYESNLAWWNEYKPQLIRFLDRFDKRVVPRYIEFVKKLHGIDVDFEEFDLIKTIQLFQELYNILDHSLGSRDIDLYAACLIDDSMNLEREMRRQNND